WSVPHTGVSLPGMMDGPGLILRNPDFADAGAQSGSIMLPSLAILCSDGQLFEALTGFPDGFVCRQCFKSIGRCTEGPAGEFGNVVNARGIIHSKSAAKSHAYTSSSPPHSWTPCIFKVPWVQGGELMPKPTSPKGARLTSWMNILLTAL